MAQTIIRGGRDVNTAQDQIIPPQVVQNRIDLLTRDDAPWTALTRSMKKKKAVGDSTYFVYQDLLVKGHTTLAETATVGDTTWVLAAGTGAYVAGWDILWNRTRDVYVHAKSRSTDTITVLANADSGTDTQGEVGDEIIIIGNATQEGGGVVGSVTTQEVKRTNYVTDIQTSVEFTDMARNSDSYFEEDDFEYQLELKGQITHQRKIERALKLGPRPTLFTPAATYENPTQESTYQAAFTQSFKTFMDTYADADHVKTDTDLTEAEFIRNFEQFWFAEGEGHQKSKKPVLFASQKLATAITLWNIGRGRYSMDKAGADSAVPGMKFMRWTSPFGDVPIIIDHDLTSNISGGVNYYFCVDKRFIGYVPYRNLDTHIRRKVPVTRNGKIDLAYIRTVMGSYYTQENAHFFGKFVTTS